MSKVGSLKEDFEGLRVLREESLGEDMLVLFSHQVVHVGRKHERYGVARLISHPTQQMRKAAAEGGFDSDREVISSDTTRKAATNVFARLLTT